MEYIFLPSSGGWGDTAGPSQFEALLAGVEPLLKIPWSSVAAAVTLSDWAFGEAIVDDDDSFA